MDETLLEYLYRLNVAAIRAKILIRYGTPVTRREHVEHFIETIDDRDLAIQLTLLRLNDADAMEETLRAYQRMEAQRGKTAMGSSKFRQRSAFTSDPASSKPARAVRAIKPIDSAAAGQIQVDRNRTKIDVVYARRRNRIK